MKIVLLFDSNNKHKPISAEMTGGAAMKNDKKISTGSVPGLPPGLATHYIMLREHAVKRPIGPVTVKFPIDALCLRTRLPLAEVIGILRELRSKGAISGDDQWQEIVMKRETGEGGLNATADERPRTWIPLKKSKPRIRRPAITEEKLETPKAKVERITQPRAPKPGRKELRVFAEKLFEVLEKNSTVFLNGLSGSEIIMELLRRNGIYTEAALQRALAKFSARAEKTTWRESA